MANKTRLWLLPSLLIIIHLVYIGLTIVERPSDLTLIALLNDLTWLLLGIVYAAVGGLIVTQQPRQIIGWLLMALPFVYAFNFPLERYILATINPDIQASPLITFYAWFSGWNWWLLIGPILLILQLFPTGNFISRTWRRLGYFLAATFIYFMVMATFTDQFQFIDTDVRIPNPIGFIQTDSVETMALVFSGLLLVNAVSAVISVFARYRQSDLVARAQLRWLLFAAALFLISYTPGFFSDTYAEGNSIFGLLFVAAFFGIPIAIGMAVLRYKLWDIDLVINRTLVYGGLSLIIIVLFAGVSWLMNTMLVGIESGALISTGMTAVLFGVIFQPTRKSLQRFVDRRFYHIMIDYQKTPPSFQPDFDRKQTTFGKYQDLQLAGRGGMGEVYRAYPTDGKDPVAIKMLPPNLANDETLRKRFVREAELISALSHPNIVHVYEYGTQGETPYIVMEYIQGNNLLERIQKVGRLPLGEAMPVIADLASALDYAHGKGFVHRDIKPSNIMLEENDKQPRPVLMDFGIAKILEAATLMTKSGFVGTLDYIAPEQIQSAREVDQRADIYSFGILVFQMLSSQLPFKSGNAGATLMAHMSQPPPDVRDLVADLPESISIAIQKAMSKDREERFATAGEFAAALQVG